MWVGGGARRPKRIGSKVRGVGGVVRWYVCGTTGFEVPRAAAEVLGDPWEKCEVVWGDTSKHLPFTCVSGGSQTTHAMTRAAHAVAMDARKKLQDIAAKSLGGKP